MSLNCRPGDLAVIVRSSAGNEGKVVRCLEFVGFVGDWAHTDDLLPTWRTDCRFDEDMVFIGDGYWIEDALLRPIRDPGDDARDETLDWLPSPHKEASHA